jgi:hypothetical protein
MRFFEVTRADWMGPLWCAITHLRHALAVASICPAISSMG